MFAYTSRWVTVLALFVSGYGSAQYINEFHYDNQGSDIGEFIEIVMHHPQPENLVNYRIYLYNGADSMVIDSNGRSLSGITPNCDIDSCFYVWSTLDLLQNGPDGIAFVYESETDTIVYDFISYEGVILALDGPALGMSSLDVGIEESGNTPVGWSLQLDSTGTWVAGPATPGSINPIELLSFSGQYLEAQDGVLLEWTTASELNNQYFEVQKSNDQISFTSIATIDGAQNSQDTIQYTFLDKGPLSHIIYYRLKQVDLDGSHAFSEVIAVDCPVRSSLSELVPVFRSWELSFRQNGYDGLLDITIFDNLGRKLLYKQNVYSGDVVPIDIPRRGVIFYLIQAKGKTLSGPAVVLGED